MSFRPLALLAGLAAVLSCAAPAHAAGKRYALLVGVREYDHTSFTRLKCTENDVEELARVLREAGYAEVVVLTTTRGKDTPARKPTAKNIRAELDRLSDKVTKDDLLLVGLSGHGLRWQFIDARTRKPKDESFFCPCDARPRRKQTLAELEKSMIPLGELFRRLDDSGAGVRLLLVDACRNNVKAAARNVDVDKLPRAKKGAAILFSCKGGECAWESPELGKGHGIFFYHVIRTLESEARLTWSQLVDRVIDRVTDDAPKLTDGERQTPHEIRNIEGRSPLVVDRAVRVDVEAERLYRQGVGVRDGLTGPVDIQKALKLFGQAAKRGHVLAGARVGLMLSDGMGLAADRNEGVKQVKALLPALRQKAEEGDADAQTVIGWMYESGRGVEKDYTQALRWYRKAAGKDHPPAMTHLGFLYANGRGVDKDEAEAVRWYRRAAGKDLPLAMNNLGFMYASGQGVPKDYQEAVKWYRRAAGKGLPLAMNNLGTIYEHGGGVDKDEKEAVKWYRRAADKEHPPAMANLGRMYANGRGVEKDDREAVKWYRKAAAKEHASAMNNLGAMYEHGRGVKKDEAEAVRWYRRAADKGDVIGMFNLGVMHEKGRGVKQDRPSALEWYRKAAAMGDEEARKAVQRLEANP